MSDVADIEDPKAPKPLGAHGVLDGLGAAVESGGQVLPRDKEQVPISGDVALRAGTDVRGFEPGPCRVADVPHLVSIEAALDRILPGKGQVGVDAALEFLGGRSAGDQPQ